METGGDRRREEAGSPEKRSPKVSLTATKPVRRPAYLCILPLYAVSTDRCVDPAESVLNPDDTDSTPTIQTSLSSPTAPRPEEPILTLCSRSDKHAYRRLPVFGIPTSPESQSEDTP